MYQKLISNEHQNCRRSSERKKEQTQRRRKSVVKGRGFDGGKKVEFVAQSDPYKASNRAAFNRGPRRGKPKTINAESSADLLVSVCNKAFLPA